MRKVRPRSEHLAPKSGNSNTAKLGFECRWPQPRARTPHCDMILPRTTDEINTDP